MWAGLRRGSAPGRWPLGPGLLPPFPGSASSQMGQPALETRFPWLLSPVCLFQALSMRTAFALGGSQGRGNVYKDGICQAWWSLSMLGWAGAWALFIYLSGRVIEVLFTYYNMQPFMVFCSVVFSIVTEWCSCHHCVILEHSHHHPRDPVTVNSHSSPPPSAET